MKKRTTPQKPLKVSSKMRIAKLTSLFYVGEENKKPVKPKKWITFLENNQRLVKAIEILFLLGVVALSIFTNAWFLLIIPATGAMLTQNTSTYQNLYYGI